MDEQAQWDESHGRWIVWDEASGSWRPLGTGGEHGDEQDRGGEPACWAHLVDEPDEPGEDEP